MIKVFLFIFLICSFHNTFYGQEYTLIHPKQSWNSSNGEVDFEWNNYLNLNCQVEVSSASDFSTFLLVSPMSPVDSWSATQIPYGDWFWRVRFINGTSQYFSNMGSFTVFNPSQSTSLSLYLTPDSGVILDTDNKIQSLTDQSASAFVFSQSNAVKRPFVETNVLNGESAFRFSGGQCLIGGDILDLQTSSRTMYVVGKTDQANGAFFAKSLAGAASSRYAMLKENNKYLYLMFDNLNVGNPLNSAVGYNDFGLFSATVDRAISKFYFDINNQQIGLNPFTASGNINSTFRFIFGAYNNSGDNNEVLYFNGYINEIVFIETADSDEKLKVQNYLRYKYCPPIDLGKDTTIANNFCPINLNIETGYTNVLWSTGETAGTISVNQPGLYWVRGTDLFGYVSYDTVQVNYPEIQAPNSEFICLGLSVDWDAGLGNNYTYNWTTGATSESISITTPGSYSVTVTDQLGCTRISDPIIFGVDFYSNTTYIGADTSLCTGNPIALQVGAAETVSYAWQGNTASTVPSFAVGETGNYWVESVNVNGCVARDTIFITNVGTAPIAQFSVNDHCKGLSSGIVDQSTGVGADNVVLWHWNLGNGTELSQQTVNYTYPAAGNYPIELYVQSAGGCGAYHYDTVQVFETPQADFNFIGHCQGQEVLFTEGAISGGAPISYYSWNFDMPWMGAYNTSTINIPNRMFDQVGTYDVVLQVTDGNGCQDAVTLPVVIDPTPVANYVFESTCQGSPIQFLNTSVTQASSTYLWDFGDNTSSILVNPAKTFPDYGIVSVQLSVTNLSGCTDTVLQNVQVFAFPLTSLQIGPACMDSYATLENTSNVPLGAIDSTIWILNQTDTLHGTDAAWMVSSMGQQQVDMFTWSDQGCMSQTSQFFDVNEQFNASFSIGPGIVATGQPFVFENTTNTASVSLWNFDDGGFSTDFSPVHTFNAAYADSTLTVLLIALSPSGCVDSTTQEILIQRARIDLEITNLFLQKENAWYIMGVKLKNKGTVNLESAQLVVETTKGLLFNETWNGTLKPTEDSIYVFSGMPTTIFTDQDLVESYICVSGLGFDLYGNAESYLENNNVCRNIEGEGIVLLPVYPNPVYDDFTARIYVTKEAEVTFELTDDRGRTIENFINAQTIGAGYYDYTVNTDQLSPGVYFLKVRSNDATQSSKLIFIRK